MDSAVSTAARALVAGDPLQALKLVALRRDAPSLALRGIAMAQLGELSRAHTLLRRASGHFWRERAGGQGALRGGPSRGAAGAPRFGRRRPRAR